MLDRKKTKPISKVVIIDDKNFEQILKINFKDILDFIHNSKEECNVELIAFVQEEVGAIWKGKTITITRNGRNNIQKWESNEKQNLLPHLQSINLEEDSHTLVLCDYQLCYFRDFNDSDEFSYLKKVIDELNSIAADKNARISLIFYSGSGIGELNKIRPCLENYIKMNAPRIKVNPRNLMLLVTRPQDNLYKLKTFLENHFAEGRNSDE